MTGTAILIEYTLAPAVVATFIGGYMDTLIGFGGPIVYLLCYLVFVGIHLYGVGEALKVTFAITAIAVVAIAAFILGMIPQFEVANLFDIQVTNAAGASSFLPFGLWASGRRFRSRSGFPRDRGRPLAAEETRDPATDMPKGLIAGMAALLLFAMLILVFGPGGAGSAAFTSDEMLAAPSVLPLALEEAWWYRRARHLRQHRGARGADRELLLDHLRLLAPALRPVQGRLPAEVTLGHRRPEDAVGRARGSRGHRLPLAHRRRGDPAQRRSLRRGDLLRPDDALAHRPEEPGAGPGASLPHPGRRGDPGVAFVLAVLAVIATFIVDRNAAFIMLGVYVLFIAYFLLYSRRHLVAQPPRKSSPP